MEPSWESWFGAAGTLAMAGWAALILLPRRAWLLRVLRQGVVVALAFLYAVLILGYFFTVEGGGYGTLAEVRALFMSDPVLLAGWVHYLAFDLFVGIWIAERADALGLHRVLQVPILIATFMFGPVGLLLHEAAAAGARLWRREARPC